LRFAAARLGVTAELYKMLQSFYLLAPQFQTAGLTLGGSFTAGMKQGIAGAQGAASNVTNIYTDNSQVNGATPRQVEKKVNDGNRRSENKRFGRRNLAR
jgi:hypothetical protein